MQPGVFLNWLMVAGSLGSCVLVLGVFIALFAVKTRRKKQRRERPPQREKLLRPAGYSAMVRIDAIAEKLVSVMLQAIGGAVMFGITGAILFPICAGLALGRFTLTQIWNTPKSSVLIPVVVVGLVALLWVIRSFLIAWQLDDELRNWRFGMRGEQAVAEKLHDGRLAAVGYVAFHDVPGDGNWNIDHVVVGPGGVFVLETKARPRRNATRTQDEHEVKFDGRKLEFPWCDDWDAVTQVQRNGVWIRKFLEGFGPKDLPVQPAIVVPGWFVTTKGNYAVKVMNAEYLIGYLSGVKRLFTSEQLEPIFRRFDERCRVLEF